MLTWTVVIASGKGTGDEQNGGMRRLHLALWEIHLCAANQLSEGSLLSDCKPAHTIQRPAIAWLEAAFSGDSFLICVLFDHMMATSIFSTNKDNTIGLLGNLPNAGETSGGEQGKR